MTTRPAHFRSTGFRPTPPGHPHFKARPFREAHEAAGGTILPLAQIQPFKRVWEQVPILDQGRSSSCVGHSFATGMMIALAEAGLYRVPLSPWFLYTLIDGGRDGGAAPGDAIDALARYGIPPDSLVPHGTVGPPGYSAAATAAALGVKLFDHVMFASFEEAVNGALSGWTVHLDVRADGPTDQIATDARGVCSFFPVQTDHEVFAGEQFTRFSDGTPVLGGRNSWGTGWGVNGRCWWTEAHFQAAQEVRGIRAVSVSPDDPAMPPPLKGAQG